MERKLFRERERAFEEVFFRKENERMLQRIRDERRQETERAELARACGIHDETLLEALLAQGVRAENLAALVLVPQVVVAWADGRLRRVERAAVLEAAARCGIEEDCPACELLEKWLDERPPLRLLEVWSEYVRELSAVLSPVDRKKFADEIMRRSRKVAHAAGWLLNLPPRESREEHEVLDQIARAFEPASPP